jgi:pimeloyl-ACP methyl ester carboxylesterase
MMKLQIAMAPQGIRFCETRDGVRIAYSIAGEGPPLVFAGRWAYSLEYAERPEATGLLDRLAQERRVITFDRRGIGASQREVGEVSLEAGLADLEAVVGAAGLDRFDLIGEHDGAHLAAAYSVRYPEKTRRLVLLGLCRDLEITYEPEAMRGLAELAAESWHLARLSMAAWVLRGVATAGDLLQWFVDILGRTMSPEMAAKYMLWTSELDATESLRFLSCPALVVHWRDDMQVPLDYAASSASYIPSAKFVVAEGDDPPWRGTEPIAGPILEFLSAADEAERWGNLTERELEVLSLLATGQSNQEIAQELSVSARTTARHIQNIYAKIGVHNRAEATAYALGRGIVAPQRNASA